MRKIYIVFMMVVIAAGLGPATAQDIYINKYKDRKSDEKPTIYLRRGSDKNSGGRSANSLYRPYNFVQNVEPSGFRHSKIQLAQNIKDVKARAEVFYAWERSGRKPETLEELISYDASKMAVREVAMIPQRKALYAYLEKEERKRQIMLARYEEELRRSEHERYARGDRVREERERALSAEATQQARDNFSKENVEKVKTSEPAIKKTESRLRQTTFDRPIIYVRPDSERKTGVFKNY